MKSRLTILLFILTLLACTTQASEGQPVYTTKTGSKYHRGNCQYLRNSKFEIELEEAQDLGYEPCRVCRPPSAILGVHERDSVESAFKAPHASPSQGMVATQCTAKTQTGSRCKRRTAHSTGKCWQHQ